MAKPTKNYNLQALYPDIAKEWHPTKNGSLKPNQVTPGSNKKPWWVCEKGHEWQTRVSDRFSNGCPYCSNRKLGYGNDLQSKYPEIAKEWHPTKNGTLKPNKIVPGSAKRVWWICDNGHEWQRCIFNRTSNDKGCKICKKTNT